MVNLDPFIGFCIQCGLMAFCIALIGLIPIFWLVG